MKSSSRILILLMAVVVSLVLYQVGFCDGRAVFWKVLGPNYTTMAFTRTVIAGTESNCWRTIAANNTSSVAACTSIVAPDTAFAKATSNKLAGDTAVLACTLTVTPKGQAGPTVSMLPVSTWAKVKATAKLDTITDTVTVVIDADLNPNALSARSKFSINVATLTGPVPPDTVSWLDGATDLIDSTYTADFIGKTIKLGGLTDQQEANLVIIVTADVRGEQSSSATPFLGTWGILALLLLLAATAWFVLSRRKVRTTGSAA